MVLNHQQRRQKKYVGLMEKADAYKRSSRDRFWDRARVLYHVHRTSDLVALELPSQWLCSYHSTVGGEERRATVILNTLNNYL